MCPTRLCAALFVVSMLSPVAVFAAPPVAFATARDFAGTFKGAAMTLILKQGTEGGLLSGTITTGGKTLPVNAHLVMQGIEGSFRSEGDDFSFNAQPGDDNKTLLFITDGTTHVLKRQGELVGAKKANPLAAGNGITASVPELPEKGNVFINAVSGEKVYQSPLGIGMRFPANWSSQETEGGLMLAPPVAPGETAAPSAIFMVRGTPASGITASDDPHVLIAADAQITQIFPSLKRSDAPVKAPTGVMDIPGVILTYDGENPQNKKPVRARVYAAVQKGVLLYVLALGEKDAVTSRDAVLRGFLATFAPNAR